MRQRTMRCQRTAGRNGHQWTGFELAEPEPPMAESIEPAPIEPTPIVREPRIMRALFNRLLAEYGSLIELYRGFELERETLHARWRVLQHQHRLRLTHGFSVSSVMASCMVHVAGMFVRQQTRLETTPKEWWRKHEEDQNIFYLEQLILADFPRATPREQKIISVQTGRLVRQYRHLTLRGCLPQSPASDWTLDLRRPA